jgi:hypothetical protein
VSAHTSQKGAGLDCRGFQDQAGGDTFPAIIQNNRRGPIVGMRTVGAGGSIVSFNCTSYSERICRITVSLMNRGELIHTPEYPAAPYIENIGVRPHIVLDYMTRENLMTGGASFFQAFTHAVVKQIGDRRTPPSA